VPSLSVEEGHSPIVELLELSKMFWRTEIIAMWAAATVTLGSTEADWSRFGWPATCLRAIGRDVPTKALVAGTMLPSI